MRMVHYFGALALLTAPALLATAATGLAAGGSQTHLTVGLFTAVAAVAAHTLLILFMIVTGRVIKAAMKSRTLDDAYLQELNAFFARKPAYPLAVLAATAIVATGVLGYASRGFDLSPAVHMLVGLGALLLNLWALGAEWRTLLENQTLLDRTAAELDRLDRERRDEVVEVDLEEGFRYSPSVRWLLASVAVWCPWLYWGFVVWRGDFERVSDAFLWGSAFVSAFCLLSAWLTRGVTVAGASELESGKPG